MLRCSRRSAALAVQLGGWPVLALAAIARLSRSRQAPPLELLDIFHPYLLGVWASVGVLAGWARTPSLGLLAAAGGALALERALAVVGHARGPGPTCGPPVRTLTANVLAGSPGAAGLAWLIDRERPDLVALQEVRAPYWEELVGRLGHALPFRVAHPHEDFNGAAILSRWPLHDVEAFRPAGRGHFSLRADLVIDGRRLRMYNVHLQTDFELYRRRRGIPRLGIRHRPASGRDEQIEELLRRLARHDGPTVVLGDFNAAAGSRPHRRLRTVLRDAFLEVGRGHGHTFPQGTVKGGLRLPMPLLRIDYAFLKGPLEPIASRAATLPGSDHRAVITEVGFAPRAPIQPCDAQGSTSDAARPVDR